MTSTINTSPSRRSAGSRTTKTSKGFELRTYEPAPDGFDPSQASDRQLLHHGLPRRPDAEKQAAWRAVWDKAISRPTTWIVPEFHEMPERTHGPMLADGVADRAELANATSTNWSGAADFAAKGSPFRWVAGQWTVPNPHAPGSGSYYASEWVGIDGDGSNDVLQAGTETEVIEILWFTLTNVYTWFEWFPAGEVAISNLSVSPGDVMYCLICVTSTTTATVYFSNQSTNVSTSFTITAPAGTSLQGNSAEWVVERPSVNGQATSLTDYDVVYFDECLAGWSGRGTIGVDDLSGATPITMTDGSGTTLSEPTVENNHVLKLTWRAAN